MLVKIMLKFGLDKLINKEVVECDVRSGEKITEVFRIINFPAERAGVVLVDGIKKGKDSALYGGEVIKVFPEHFNAVASTASTKSGGF